LWEEYKYGFIKKMVLNGIARGKKEGIFRKDVNDELMANFRPPVMTATFPSSLLMCPPPCFVPLRPRRIVLLRC
ncbi:MAG: hypothetical protein AAF513_15125, partial [Pseudomonadota bacterium]